jgi:hypothetical protein
VEVVWGPEERWRSDNLEVRIGITVSGREPGGLLKRGELSNSVPAPLGAGERTGQKEQQSASIYISCRNPHLGQAGDHLGVLRSTGSVIPLSPEEIVEVF